MARIAEYLHLGEGLWWHHDGEDIIFHDSNTDLEFQPEGPLPSNFRSSSLKTEISQNELSGSISVKISKDGKPVILYNTFYTVTTYT